MGIVVMLVITQCFENYYTRNTTCIFKCIVPKMTIKITINIYYICRITHSKFNDNFYLHVNEHALRSKSNCCRYSTKKSL